MRARIDLFFTLHDEGWSENINATVASYAAAATLAQTYADGRCAMMCNDVEVIGARVHDTDVKNDYWPITLRQAGVFSGITGDKSTEPFSAALQMKLWSTVNFKRATRFFRGVPSSQLTLGVYTPTGGFTTAVNALLAFFKTSGMSIATPLGPTVPRFAFTQITDTVLSSFIVSKDTGRPFLPHRGRRAIA